MILRVSLFVLASLVLAAHFVRQASPVPTLACLLMPLLFLVRKRWSLIVLQASAYVAAAIWITTAVELAHERLAMGLPWTRAATILGGVALLNVCAGLLLNSRVAKSKY